MTRFEREDGGSTPSRAAKFMKKVQSGIKHKLKKLQKKSNLLH